jgi:hypothetical protein
MMERLLHHAIAKSVIAAEAGMPMVEAILLL